MALSALMALNSAFASAEIGLRQGLYEMDGTPADIDRYQPPGGWLVVMVWATTCHVCMEEMPKYSVYHDRNGDRGPRVLGIALDGVGQREAIASFMTRTNTTFPTLVANLGEFAAPYEALAKERLIGTPTFMLFDPKGKLVGLNPGPMRPEALDAFIARRSQRGS